MKTQQKIICVLVVAVLLANTCLSALADDGLVMTQAELEAAWALTGLDENAARYREGMAFSENMNARQMELWLDEVLNEEASAVQQLFSQLENTLYKMKQENPALYDSLTENRNGADYLRLKESYVEAENLRQLIRYYRDQLNIKANVIQSRMERIGNANYSLSAQLTASREIEEAARVIQKIRGELTQNALSWVSWLTSTHGSMTGTSANNGLGTDDGHAQWIESILTYGTRPAVSTKTSASVLYPNEGRSLTARLLPVSSALADSSEEITVMAVDENHFGIQTLSKADGSPLSGSSITVTGLDNGYSQTETTDDTGAVTFNANDFAPNADGEVNLSIEASSSGQQSYLVESTVMQKGGIRKDNMENDEGTPYVLAASFKSRETHDILMGTYTAFYSKYNDDTFDLKITASQHCTVTLQYVDVNGNKQTVSGETGNEDNSVTFSKTWKNMVKPGTKMTVSLSGGKTKDLGLSFVKGVNEQPITAVTNLLSIFSGGGITFTLPGKYLKPLGDMSVNFSIPWEQYFSVRGIGTLDGTFILYAGAFADCSDQVDWLQNNWKTIDQEGLEKDIKALEDNQQSTKDALKNGLTNGFNGASPQKHPVLGNMTLSLTAGGMFLGKYIKTGSGSSENWQYSFEFVAGAVAAFDYSLDVYFIVTPFPIYLDIRLQLSTMVDVFLAFMASMEDGNRVKAKFDYNAGGLSFTIRFTVTVGVTLGLKGVFTVTIGGYFYIQITLTFSNQGFEGTAVWGAACSWR